MSKARCGIAFDLDGVMWRLPHVFPFAKPSIEKVIQHKIPYVLLTNGGGSPENEKIKIVNQRLDMQVMLFIFATKPLQTTKHQM